MTDSHPQPDHHVPAWKPPKNDAEWDDMYASTAQLFSGRPNFALVTDVSGLQPGRALDVGCGEGADAVWLASQGWAVTALDVSQVALDRAAQSARQSAVNVQWLHAGLVDAALPEAGFDLVSAQYPALPSSPDHTAERGLLAVVAPGGLLHIVYHAGFDSEEAKSRGIDPADYVWPTDVVAALLAGDWQIRIDTERPRDAPAGGAGQHHSHDVVIQARRNA
jgi:SAM-dependent methyltransferase